MGVHCEHITYSSEVSLTLIVDDITRQRHEGAGPSKTGPMDLLSWLNALQRQSAPLLHSRAARENLEAWLEEVQAHINSKDDSSPLALSNG